MAGEYSEEDFGSWKLNVATKASGLNPYYYLIYLFEKFPMAQKPGILARLTEFLPDNIVLNDLLVLLQGKVSLMVL